MKKQKAWHNRDHHNGPVRMSLSKHGLKDLAVCFHLRTISCGSALGTRLPQNTIWSILCLLGPTIMDSAKQINFLPIFKVFQNWRIYLFGWHSISWTLIAVEAKRWRRLQKQWGSCSLLGKGNLRQSVTLGKVTEAAGGRTCGFSLPHFPRHLIYSACGLTKHFALVLYRWTRACA